MSIIGYPFVHSYRSIRAKGTDTRSVKRNRPFGVASITALTLVSLALTVTTLSATTIYPPYAGATASHNTYLYTWWVGLAGSQYDPHGNFNPSQGVMAHGTGAAAGGIGAGGSVVRDELRGSFTVPTTGEYEITINARIQKGTFLSPSLKAVFGANASEYSIDFIGMVYDSSGSIAHKSEHFASQSFNPVKAIALEVASALASDLIKAIDNRSIRTALNLLHQIDETYDSLGMGPLWTDRPVSRTLRVSLVAGATYSWAFVAQSSVSAMSVSLGGQVAYLNCLISVDNINVSYVGPGTFNPPTIEAVAASPNPVYYGSTLEISALNVRGVNSDVQSVVFYRDSNRNGGYDPGIDEELGPGIKSGSTWRLTTPANWGYGRQRVFARAKDSNNLWSDAIAATTYIEPAPAVQGNHISIQSFDWSDYYGDRDGVIETGEEILLRIRLRSTVQLDYIMGGLSSSLGNMLINRNRLQYPPVSSGASVWPYGDGFSMMLDLAPTHNVPFNLRVEYYYNGQDYYQDFTFSKIFYEQGTHNAQFNIVSYDVNDSVARAPYNNADGIIQSGERVDIRPLLRNGGQANATDIRMWLSYAGDKFEIDGVMYTDSFPDLAPGQQAYAKGAQSFSIRNIKPEYSGTEYIDINISYEQSSEPIVLPAAIAINIQPAAWLNAIPRAHDFGVAEPGDIVSHILQIRNYGSTSMDVTGINTSVADAAWVGPSLPFTLAAGQSTDVVVQLDTSGLQGNVSRQVTIQSTGRIRWPGEHDVFTLSGLVSAAVPIMTIPGVTGARNPDVSGNWIVWSDNSTGNWDIWAYNKAEGRKIQVTTNAEGQFSPKISGSLIAWTDRRNPDGYADVYAFDLNKPELGEFPVSTAQWDDRLIGVDENLIAVTSDYFIFTEPSNWGSAVNLVVYEYNGNGGFTVKYHSNFPQPSGKADIPSFSAGGDFDGGLLVVRRHTIFWSSYGYWSSKDQRLQRVNFALNENSPSDAVPLWNTMPFAMSGRFLYGKRVHSGYDEIWRWRSDGDNRVVAAEVDYDLGRYALAGIGLEGQELIIFDYRQSERTGLYFLDRSIGGVVSQITHEEGSRDVRADGNCIVWRAVLDADQIRYSYLKQPDVSVSHAGITFSDSSPIEGSRIDVSVLVRNLTPYRQVANIAVHIYDGDPDSGGVLLAPAQILNGLAAKTDIEVIFGDVTTPPAGERSIYAVLEVSEFDPPANNKAYAPIWIQDGDTLPPGISNFLVAGLYGDGNGDGIIGSDDAVRVSWSLFNESGISAVTCVLNGESIVVEGNYDDGYYGDLGTLPVGIHTVLVTATDAASSPQTSEANLVFHVVQSAMMDVTFDSMPVPNDESGYINLGLLSQNVPADPRFFEIRNYGAQRLFLQSPVVTGPITAGNLYSDNVSPSAATTFEITPATGAEGIFTGSVSIDNSDLSQSPYTFNVVYEVRSDTVGNGVPDEWELRYFPALGIVTPTSDYDGDGALDIEEYIAGTDPTDPKSIFRVNTFVMDQVDWDHVTISWDSVTGRLYRVYGCPALNTNWSIIFERLGNGSAVSYTHDLNSGNRFFKLDVRIVE